MQKNALHEALVKLRSAAREAERLQSKLNRNMEQERQSQSTKEGSQSQASDGATSSQSNCASFHLQQRVFSNKDLIVSGNVVVTRFTPGTIIGFDFAADRVLLGLNSFYSPV